MEGCEGGGGLSGTAVQDSCGGRPRLVRAHDRAVTAGIGERGSSVYQVGQHSCGRSQVVTGWSGLMVQPDKEKDFYFSKTNFYSTQKSVGNWENI
jgi:hypothetical protein